jgi:protein-disulfide isomerase
VLAYCPKDNLPKAGDAPTNQAAQAAPPQDAVAAWLAEFDSKPRVDVGVPADGAKVVIVKWNDFQCPSCREGFVWYKPVLDKYAQSHPGAIKFVIKDFPLEGECNYSTPNMNHYAACESSVALRLAREAGKDREMEAWLFDNQARLNTEVVREGYETVTGRSDFASRYAAVLADVRQDVSDGVALQIGQTPTYFINGVRVLGNLQPQWLEVLIEHELNKGGA